MQLLLFYYSILFCSFCQAYEIYKQSNANPILHNSPNYLKKYPNPRSLFPNYEIQHIVNFDEYSVKEFYNTVYESDKIWVIYFYAHWCGHSIQFSSMYKGVAKRIYNDKTSWEKVYAFGAVDCANELRVDRGTITCINSRKLKTRFPRFL